MTAPDAMRARFEGRWGAFSLDIAFEAPARGVTALFGPSGCGKTTTLRCIAGLQRAEEGFFALGDEVWQDSDRFRPPHARPIGYVFQEASLFPHLSVRGNLLYGRRRALRQGATEAIRLDEVVALLGLERLLDRSPRHLSGGERQRVAMGRALLAQPRLLLMDEPLSGLDRSSRDDILPYLEALHANLAIPVLYVSHDLAEVERVSDHLVLLREGRVAAAGPLDVLQADPTLPIARLPDAAVTLPATILAYDETYGLATLAVDGGTLIMPGDHGLAGTRRRVRIGAADVSLARQAPVGSTILNILPARVLTAEPVDAVQMSIALGLGETGEGARILARVTRKSRDALALAPGDRVYAQIKGVALA